jgi:hypothetical protein
MLDISSAIKSVSNVIGELHVSDEERSKAKAALLEVENKLSADVLAYEKAITADARDIIVAEAQSASTLARNWRPILMLVITGILAHKYILYPYLSKWLDVPILDLPDALFTLLTVGVGGYVVGRSGEKIVSTLRAGTTANAEMSADLKQQRKMLKLRKKLGLD